MQEKQLKPCPFCGNIDPKIFESEGETRLYAISKEKQAIKDRSATCRISCKKCGITLVHRSNTDIATARKRAYSRWNKRTNHADHSND